ncbi:MAG TPA: hypothetical protein ENN90_06135 [Mariniphaga anaerophila]|uniref:Uncharacterized protein n=1 Tax=Mariniphaga anaerophila TaxID=1484053 RepID=A0A831PLF3_9BACT|nr:hypothetical protein [Mariniphaga anaerophila]
MPEKSIVSEQNNDFEELMGKMSDEQLKNVLQKRNHYQEKAVEAAVREAINRGLIHSEEDLMAPEFRTKPLKTKLFPKIENEEVRKKIRKSMARGLLIAGILPLILGVVKLNTGYRSEGLFVLSFGLVWMGIASSLIRQMLPNAIKILFVLTAVAVAYTGRLLFLQPVIEFMDVFIITVLFLLILYGLTFLWRLY